MYTYTYIHTYTYIYTHTYTYTYTYMCFLLLFILFLYSFFGLYTDFYHMHSYIFTVVDSKFIYLYNNVIMTIASKLL